MAREKKGREGRGGGRGETKRGGGSGEESGESWDTIDWALRRSEQEGEKEWEREREAREKHQRKWQDEMEQEQAERELREKGERARETEMERMTGERARVVSQQAEREQKPQRDREEREWEKEEGGREAVENVGRGEEESEMAVGNARESERGDMKWYGKEKEMGNERLARDRERIVGGESGHGDSDRVDREERRAVDEWR